MDIKMTDIAKLHITTRFQDWMLYEPRVELLEFLDNEPRHPHYFYLALSKRINASQLPDGYELVIKVGETEDVDSRQTQYGTRFQILAHAEVPFERLAKRIEKRIILDYAYGEDVPSKLHHLIRPASVNESRMCMIEEYDHLVDTLNQHFDGGPFPR